MREKKRPPSLEALNLARSERFELPTPWFVVRFCKPDLPFLQQLDNPTEFSPNVKQPKCRKPLFGNGTNAFNGTLFQALNPFCIARAR